MVYTIFLTFPNLKDIDSVVDNKFEECTKVCEELFASHIFFYDLHHNFTIVSDTPRYILQQLMSILTH